MEKRQSSKSTVAGIRACTWVWLTMMTLTLITYLIGAAGIDSLQFDPKPEPPDREPCQSAKAR